MFASVSTSVDLDTLRISASAPRRPLTIAFTVLWFAGWAFIIAVAVASLFLQPEADFANDAMWLGIWIAAGVPAGLGLLWAAGGRQEALLVSGPRVIVQRRAGWFRRARVLDAFSARNLRVIPPAPRSGDRHAIRQFWTDSTGRVQFECNGRTYGFGAMASDADAADIVATLAGRFPHMLAVNPEADAPQRTPRWRRWGLVYVTFMLLVPVTIPIRLVLQDRVTCFGGGAEPPEAPIDVSALPGAGRVYLVPFDGFAPERAAAVADYYRREFGTPIEVAPAAVAPSTAYNPVRRQASAGVLLEALARLYPSERAVVIGLTDADIYIPGVNWRYAFSYRRDGRLAVVSTARMNRGCFGLVRASEERRIARLQKMVGKNIGVMYYKLPLSGDPRSLLYAHVGGPQELDAMSPQY